MAALSMIKDAMSMGIMDVRSSRRGAIVASLLLVTLAAGVVACGGSAGEPRLTAIREADEFVLNDMTEAEQVIEDVIEAEPAALDGRGLYMNNCAACHGVVGEGQAGWQQRNPDGSFRAPAHDSTGHTWHHPDGLLFRIVRDGGTDILSLGVKSGMPAFGEILSDDQIVAVIEYLKTLWEPEGRDFQAEVTSNTGDRFPP